MADDIPASTATTSVLAANGTAGSSSIDTAGDRDWWKVELKAGYTYTLRLNSASGSSLDASLRLLDSTGRLLKANDDNGSGSNSLIAFTPKADGTFYLAAQGYKGSTGAYSITASADAILATTATTSALTLNGTASTGSIEAKGDQDWWSVELTANTTYTFRLDTSTFSSLDTYLRLLDGTGKQLKADDDGGSGYNALLTFTPASSGKYFLAAEGYKHSTGGYWLSASYDAVPAAATSSATLAPNGAAASGAIDTAGDRDWWKAELTAGTTYAFRLGKASTSGLDAYLRLLDASGKEILVDNNGAGGSNALVTYTPAATGTYFLSAEGARKSSGAYSLVGTFDTIAATTATGSILTVGGTAGTGWIDTAGDQDWWKVELTAGTAYTLQLSSNSSYALDPYLRLLDSSGQELKVDDNGGSLGGALISYTPTASGTYFLSAQGAQGSGGSYSLTAKVAATTPNSVADSVAASLVGVPGGDSGAL